MRKKFKQTILKPIFILSFLFSVFSMSSVAYLSNYLPDSFNVVSKKDFVIESKIPVSVKESADKSFKVAKNEYDNLSYTVNIKAFGFIPVKSAGVVILNESYVVPSGKPFGIKIYTDGVMIINIDSVDTENGYVYPAKDAGLKVGDVIVSINGINVHSNEEVADVIEKSTGKILNFKVKRNKKEFVSKVNPKLSYSSGQYKTGIWVRDSSAGIGTMTFYSPANKITCGLGHGICDSDTGEILSLKSGELVNAEIIDITKSVSGTPGEIKGRFNKTTIGKLLANTETGVYAVSNEEFNAADIAKIALKQEVKKGEAKILTTVESNGKPKLYSCKIEKISYNNNITKNMIIRITDKELLEKTGGIIQGMSGSPIIQNGKLIGAVTHVFIDDCTCGYAIFAENMMSTAKRISDK